MVWAVEDRVGWSGQSVAGELTDELNRPICADMPDERVSERERRFTRWPRPNFQHSETRRGEIILAEQHEDALRSLSLRFVTAATFSVLRRLALSFAHHHSFALW